MHTNTKLVLTKIKIKVNNYHNTQNKDITTKATCMSTKRNLINEINI